MKKKLFGNSIEPACRYCRFGLWAKDGKRILCENKGIVEPYYSCRRFAYDPLKRIPHADPHLPRFDADDFKID